MKNFFKLDWVLNAAVLLLLAIGMIALYSISTVNNRTDFGHLEKQAISAVIGIALFLIFSFSDYRMLNSFSTRLYFLALAALIVVLLFGSEVRGTTGWLGLGNFHFQPVEAVKLVMIIFMSSFLSRKKSEFGDFAKITATIVAVVIPVFLILSQPDFGSASIIVAIWAGMILVSGIGKKSVFVLFLIGALTMSSGWFLLKDYQKDRLSNFVNPFNDPQGSGYNVIQSIVAVGSGGIWGKGLGHGSQSQLNFLPEKHTDFIFAVIAEELGLFGSIFVLFLFGVIIFRIKKAAAIARDNFGYLMAAGIIIMLFAQILINIGMNIGLAPVTGVPLPLLSYGGSSLTIILASLGLVQSIYARRMKVLD